MEMEMPKDITQIRKEARDAMEKGSDAYTEIAAAIRKAEPLSEVEKTLLKGCEARAQEYADDMKRESTRTPKEIREEIKRHFFGDSSIGGWLDTLKSKDETGAVARWEQPIRNILSDHGVR